MSIYGTLPDADDYHEARANSAWAGTGSDPDRAAALVRATDYIDGRYRWMLPSGRWQSMFTGERTAARAQDREWPRTDAVDYDGNAIDPAEIPIEVQHATYEAALRELVTPGSLSPDYVASQQVTREKVGPIEVSYAESVASDNMTPNRPIIPAIDQIIAPVLLRPYILPAVFVV